MAKTYDMQFFTQTTPPTYGLAFATSWVLPTPYLENIAQDMARANLYVVRSQRGGHPAWYDRLHIRLDQDQWEWISKEALPDTPLDPETIRPALDGTQPTLSGRMSPRDQALTNIAQTAASHLLDEKTDASPRWELFFKQFAYQAGFLHLCRIQNFIWPIHPQGYEPQSQLVWKPIDQGWEITETVWLSPPNHTQDPVTSQVLQKPFRVVLQYRLDFSQTKPACVVTQYTCDHHPRSGWQLRHASAEARTLAKHYAKLARCVRQTVGARIRQMGWSFARQYAVWNAYRQYAPHNALVYQSVIHVLFDPQLNQISTVLEKLYRDKGGAAGVIQQLFSPGNAWQVAARVWGCEPVSFLHTCWMYLKAQQAQEAGAVSTPVSPLLALFFKLWDPHTRSVNKKQFRDALVADPALLAACRASLIPQLSDARYRFWQMACAQWEQAIPVWMRKLYQDYMPLWIQSGLRACRDWLTVCPYTVADRDPMLQALVPFLPRWLYTVMASIDADGDQGATPGGAAAAPPMDPSYTPYYQQHQQTCCHLPWGDRDEKTPEPPLGVDLSDRIRRRSGVCS